MVGGDTGTPGDPASQQVVLIELPPWGKSKMTSALKSVDRQNDASFVAAVERMGASPDAATLHAAFAGFTGDIQSNITRISALTVHARGRELKILSAIAERWNALLQTANQIAAVADPASVNKATLEAGMRSEIAAIREAERQAGDPHGLLSGGAVAA
jgi:hypothetical protein